MMRQKWTQLHPSQWPSIIRMILSVDEEKGRFYEAKRELTPGDYAELWQHQIGYYLIRAKSGERAPRKYWMLVSHANGEFIADWNFMPHKKKPPITEANKILRNRLLGTRIS